MSPEEYAYFFPRSPRCRCGKKMELFATAGTHAYRCNHCIVIVSLKAAGADFSGKHRGQMRHAKL